MKKLTIATIVLFAASILMFAASTIAVNQSFTDVSTDDWFYEDAMKMADWGVIQGYPNGSFGPGNNINRAELSAMWNRYDNRTSSITSAASTTADFFVAANVTSMNELYVMLNDELGMPATSTCVLIELLIEQGTAAIDNSIKYGSTEQFTPFKEDYLNKMNTYLDLCEGFWE